MNLKEAIEILEKYQLWRRDTDEVGYKMPSPSELGIAIDLILEKVKEL